MDLTTPLRVIVDAGPGHIDVPGYGIHSSVKLELEPTAPEYGTGTIALMHLTVVHPDETVTITAVAVELDRDELKMLAAQAINILKGADHS